MAFVYYLFIIEVEGMSGKIKILYTIPNFDTAGSGKAMLKIAQRLDDSIFEPHFCCFHDRGKFFEVVKASGIPVHLFDYTTPMIPRIRGFKNAWKISRFFKKERFDLIHSFHYSDDYSEALSAKLAGVKWIFTKKNMNWGAKSWRMRSKLASGIVAQNTDMIKSFFPGWKNVQLIGRGVDTTEFKIFPKSAELQREFELDETNKVIISVANLVPVKGIEYLIQAFQHVASKISGLKLFIIGDNDNDYGRELMTFVDQHNMQDAIIFTGRRMDINQFHSIADLFVLPTLNKGRQEGSPVALLEAMASGSLSIASNVAGIRDQLASLPDQLFIPANVQHLADKMEYFITLNQNDIDDLIQKQSDIILNNYTIQHEVQRHEAFYKSILGYKD